MRILDEWAANNLPSFGVSALGIFGGIVVVSMLAGGGAVGILAGLILGPFPGWGAAILLHQLLVAKPMREEDARRSEEQRSYWDEKRRLEAEELQELSRLRIKDPAKYKRRCQQRVEERRQEVAEKRAEWKEIMERGRRQ